MKTTTASAFDQFWAAYPRKVGKGAARRAFATAQKKIALDRMLDTLTWQRQSAQWTKEGGVFIPYPATWLRNEQWDDEPEAATSSPAVAAFLDRHPWLRR